jgi:hypothetical protein
MAIPNEIKKYLSKDHVAYVHKTILSRLQHRK